MDEKVTQVLIIDDDADDRKFLKRLLSQGDPSIHITEFADGEQPLGLVDRTFDAIFLDHYMPGKTGLSFLPDIRGKWPEVAIFLMTGQGDETVAKSAILQGATDYFSKGQITADSLSVILSSGLEAARANWRIEQQRLELATFSEVLVHDFKAPIRAAAFLAEQIGEDLDAGEMQDVQNGLRLLKKSADQMNEMIKSLSDHIRLDREIVFLKKDPRKLVEAAQDALSLDIEERGAVLDIEVEDGVPLVMCDGPQIAQVLQNLVANAVKFSEGEAPVVKVRIYGEADSVLFEVADEGCGIPPEHIEAVFLPFKRAPGAAGVAGTGLGLSTCQKIVLRHHGRIWCQSVVGKGTKFFFTLPVVAESADNLRTHAANFPGPHTPPAWTIGV